MQINDNLNRKILKAVQTSMRIEGYQPTQSQATQQQTKTLMEQQRVKVSIPGK